MSYVTCPNCGVTLDSPAALEPPSTCPECCARLRPDGALGHAPSFPRPGPELDAVVLSGRDAPREIRHEFEVFARRFGDEVRAVAALLVSELVTNAVVHGPGGTSSMVLLHADARDGALHVDVADAGDGFAVAERGVGLRLLDSLAASWGVDGRRGTRVWFELPV